jgi:hypothetical protein
VTEQLVTVPEPLSEQLVLLRLPPPEAMLQVTAPFGVRLAPLVTFATVAVHEVAVLGVCTRNPAHETVVDVTSDEAARAASMVGSGASVDPSSRPTVSSPRKATRRNECSMGRRR